MLRAFYREEFGIEDATMIDGIERVWMKWLTNQRLPDRKDILLAYDIGTNITKEDLGYWEQDLIVGYSVELEHGTEMPQTNVTDDMPIPTAQISYRHLKETPYYYRLLAMVEAYGDILRVKHPDRVMTG